MSEFPPPPPPPPPPASSAAAAVTAAAAAAAAASPAAMTPDFAMQWALAQRFMEQMRAAQAAQAQAQGGAAAAHSLMMPPASASAAAAGAHLPRLVPVGAMSAPAANVHSQPQPSAAARPKSGPGSRGGKTRGPADPNKPKKPRASTKKSAAAAASAAAASAMHDDSMPSLVPFTDSSSVRGRPRGRPRGSGLPAGETHHSASASAAAFSSPAAAVAAPKTDGSVRIGGVLYVPSTFVVVGPKHSKVAQLSALQVGRRRVRSLARRGGSQATLPSVDYSEAFLPTAAAVSSPVSPASASSSGRQGTKRKAARRSTATAYHEWHSSDEDAFMETLDDEDEDGGGRGTKSAAAAASAPKKPRAPRAPKDPSAASADSASGAKPRKSAAKSADSGGAAAAARSVEPQWQEIVPEFDPALPRQCMFNFTRDTRLPMDVLPLAYRSPTFVDVMEAIKTWSTLRFRMNQPALAAEMGCSNSTIYFLCTNTYKYDLTNFNIRVRHYLWRNDQWMVGRTRQILGGEGGAGGGGAAAAAQTASAAQVAAAAAAASGAAGGPQAMEIEQSPAAVSSSPAAASAAAAAPAAAAAVPPIPPELLALDPPVSLADWRSWLDCTMAISSRPRIDDALWPRVREVESEVKARWDDEQRVLAAARAQAEREQMIAMGIKFTPEETAAAEAAVAAASAAATATTDEGKGPRGKRLRKLKLAARLDAADFAADDDYEMLLTGSSSKPAGTGTATKGKTKKHRSKKGGGGEEGSDDEEFTGEAAAAAAAADSGASSASDTASSSSDSDRAASGNEDDSGDDGGVTGAKGSGAKRAKSKPGRRRTLHFEGATSNYPLSRSLKTSVRHSAALASDVFKQPRWNFSREGDSPLVTVDVQQILVAHLPAVLQGPATTKLVSNGRAFELPVLGAALNNFPSAAAVVVASGDASSFLLGGNALINVGSSVSAMAWAPLGDATHSPMECTQYLAVALHLPHQYIRLTSSEPSSNLILVYSCSLLDSSAAPRLALVLTHTHGSCLSLRFYPHSLETFGAADSVQRMGVLAAVFTDGACELRAIPKPTLHAQQPQQPNAPQLVDSTMLSALPGFAVSAAPGSSATCVAFSPAQGSCLVAVGASDGLIRVLDLEESESDLFGSSAAVQEQKNDAAAFSSACLTIHVRVTPSSLVSSLVFHPLLPHFLAGCTVDGRVLLWDLRAPEVELLVAGHLLEICRSIHWPLVSHTSLEVLVVAQAGSLRMIPLQKSSPLLQEGKNNWTAELSACGSMPLQPSAIIVDLAAGERNSSSEPWLLVGANSDGTLFGYKENLDQQQKYAHATKGLSVTRWTTRAAAAVAAAGATGASAGTAGGEQKQAADSAAASPAASSSSIADLVLEVSDSFPRKDTTQRAQVSQVRASRQEPSAIQQYSNPFPPSLIARDTSTPLTSVAINPNIVFPHVVAAGGLGGIVRMQTVRDM